MTDINEELKAAEAARAILTTNSNSKGTIKVHACHYCGQDTLILTKYTPLAGEMTMAKANLPGMTVEALMELRKQVDETLLKRRAEIEHRLKRLDVAGGARGRGESALKGIKVPPKYRGPSGETWAGERGKTSLVGCCDEEREEA